MMQFLLIVCLGFSTLNASPSPLRVGWDSRVPYVITNNHLDVHTLSGIDIEITTALLKKMAKSVEFVHVSAHEQTQALKDGKVDVLMAQHLNDLPKNFVHTTAPYREESITFFVKKPFQGMYFSTKDVATAIKTGSHTVGGYRNTPLKNEELKQALITSPHVKWYDSEYAVIQAFLNEEIDSFIGDRLVMTTLILNTKIWGKVIEFNISLTSNVSLAFSKKNFTEADIETVNKLIVQSKKDGTFSNILRPYIVPLIKLLTEEENWFNAIYFIGFIGFLVFSLIASFERSLSLVHTLAFTSITVFFGPILKDLLTQSPIILWKSTLALKIMLSLIVIVHFGMILIRRINYGGIRNFIFSPSLDIWLKRVGTSLGISAYAIYGTFEVVAVDDISPIWLWGPAISSLTALSGIFLAKGIWPFHTHRNLMGSEVTLLWTTVLSFYLSTVAVDIDFQQNNLFIVVVICMFGLFMSRLMVMYHSIPSVTFAKKMKENLRNL